MTRTSLTPFRGEARPLSRMEREMDLFGRDMDRLFGEFFGTVPSLRRFRFPDEWESLGFSPSCDVEDRETEFVLTAEVPGYTRDELHVDVSGDTLSLRGERTREEDRSDTRYVCRESCRGSFERTFRLSDEIDVEHVEAKLKDGILTLVLPKLHRSEHHQIEVTEA